MEQKLLTINESAKYLGVSRWAFYAVLNSNDPPAVTTVLKRQRFSVDALDAWIKKHTQ